MNPVIETALRKAKRIYVTTWSRAGAPGTVPVWFMAWEGCLFFTTLPASLKARRIAANGRVAVHVGSRRGPAFEGRAEWVEDRPDLEAQILGAYRRKYPILAGLVMAWAIGRRLARKESAVIRITPASPSGAPPAEAPAS